MTTKQFNKYIEQTRGQMLRFACAILRSELDAEDVVSAVVERLWRDREKLKEGRESVSFAMTAIRNGCYDHTRHKKRWKNEEANEKLITSEHEIEKSDRIELVRYAMSKLPDRQREIIHLKDIEGYDTNEIAQIFDIEPTNVRMILSRGRIALRDIIINISKSR